VTAEPSREEVNAAAQRLGSPESVVAGILDIVGARALALDALLRLSAIEWSAEVTTACVECADRPRLLINPLFVERWCATKERLAALLMHELAHVSMGHTRLFPRAGVLQNIACDAVINRELLATVDKVSGDTPRFAALFEDYYKHDHSPSFLLRPPPGWPQSPNWKASKSCPKPLRDIHRRLYAVRDGDRQPAKGGTFSRYTVMYSEIVAALRSSGVADGANCVSLLGGHGQTSLERAIVSGGRDAAAAETMSAALNVLGGHLPAAGDGRAVHQLEQAGRRTVLERALTVLLRRAFTADTRGRNRFVPSERPIQTVNPHRDRRAPARLAIARAFAAPRPLLFDGTLIERRPAPSDALVYLDVSGSMFGVLPALHAALVPLRRALRPRLHLFSTEVVAVDALDFDRGRLMTTGGTSISPVLEHALAEARTRRAQERDYPILVLTDGWFDSPASALVQAAGADHLRIHLGVIGDGPLHAREQWVMTATRLPSL
jgi:uncharacterized protein with von Willebrand factor type A (vWA) domain